MSENLRKPPHSLDAEKAALGAVLIKPTALDDLGHLQADDFFMPIHREIFEAMRAIAERGHPIELVLLEDELRARTNADGRPMLLALPDGMQYLVDCFNTCGSAENASHYARIIAEKAQLRRMIAMCAEVQSAAYAEEASPRELMATVRERTGNIEARTPGGPVRVGDVVANVLDMMEKRGSAPQEYLVPTGIATLDRKIGGLRAGHLIVVAANPGRGKTAFAVNAATDAAVRAGIPTLVFSLEMDRDELIERQLSRGGRVNGRNVSLGRLSQREWDQVTTASARMAYDKDHKQIPLYIDDRKLTASQICAEARRWRAKHRDPRALIVIDYLQLVAADQEERTREREVALMSGMFKKLAHRTQANAPVIMISQLNRENMKGKDGKTRSPVLSDLRDSGAIEQDADVVIFPWWDTEPPPTGRHPARLIFGKYRGGFKGEVPVDWLPEFTAFEDHEEVDESQLGLQGTELDPKW